MGPGRRRWAGAMLHAVVGLAACRAAAPSPTVERLVIVLPVGNEAPALYGLVHNPGRTDLALVGIDVALAQRTALYARREHLLPTAELQAGTVGNRMPVDRIALVAGSTVRLVPDGEHALLYGLARPLVRGDSTPVTLRLAQGGTIAAWARVIAYEELDGVLALAPAGERAAGGGAGAGAAAPRDSGATHVSAAAGRALYRANGCASCHGPSGWGDGTVGRTLTPPPRDFRDAQAFRNGTDVASIAQTIATGLMAGGAMPRYPHLTNAERESLALYVISLRTPQDSTSP